MDKKSEKRLMREIVQDLARAGLVERGVVVHKQPQEELHVFWTEAGTEMVARYAHALVALRAQSDKRVAAFQEFIRIQAGNYIKEQKSALGRRLKRR